jgi:hypothetical protein
MGMDTCSPAQCCYLMHSVIWIEMGGGSPAGSSEIHVSLMSISSDMKDKWGVMPVQWLSCDLFLAHTYFVESVTAAECKIHSPSVSGHSRVQYSIPCLVFLPSWPSHQLCHRCASVSSSSNRKGQVCLPSVLMN